MVLAAVLAGLAAVLAFAARAGLALRAGLVGRLGRRAAFIGRARRAVVFLAMAVPAERLFHGRKHGEEVARNPALGLTEILSTARVTGGTSVG